MTTRKSFCIFLWQVMTVRRGAPLSMWSTGKMKFEGILPWKLPCWTGVLAEQLPLWGIIMYCLHSLRGCIASSSGTNTFGVHPTTCVIPAIIRSKSIWSSYLHQLESLWWESTMSWESIGIFKNLPRAAVLFVFFLCLEGTKKPAINKRWSLSPCQALVFRYSTNQDAILMLVSNKVTLGSWMKHWVMKMLKR